MKCPNCKKEIENGSTFCEYCGARVKKSKKGLWIIVIVFVLIAGVVLLFTQNKQSTVYEFTQNKQSTVCDTVCFTSYVDLGLPSGTLWKSKNEKGMYYTYDEAVSQFGDKLPTHEQFAELQAFCTWTWNGKGYVVKGDNGNSIILQAAGDRDCDGGVGGIGTYGRYWSSTPYDSDDAWRLHFDSGAVYMNLSGRRKGRSVRLVQ